MVYTANLKPSFDEKLPVLTPTNTTPAIQRVFFFFFTVRAANPPIGTQGEPVENFISSAFSSSFNCDTKLQNQVISSSSGEHPWYCKLTIAAVVTRANFSYTVGKYEVSLGNVTFSRKKPVASNLWNRVKLTKTNRFSQMHFTTILIGPFNQSIFFTV